MDITLEKGEFIVLLGKSGCGKSTLLKIIAGMEKTTTGSVIIDGEKVISPHPSRVLMFQEPALLPWLNVSENIMFGCKIRGDNLNLSERVARYIKRINLIGFESYMPFELSAGMCQRVCLAQSLIGKPEILLLDEPFGALDPFTRGMLQDELINLWKTRNFTAVFVTHDIEEAILLGSKILLMGGTPTRIMDTIENPLSHPRDVLKKSFLKMKSDIIEKFRHSLNDSESGFL